MAELPADWLDYMCVEGRRWRETFDLISQTYITLDVYAPGHPLLSRLRKWLQEAADEHDTTGDVDDITEML